VGLKRIDCVRVVILFRSSRDRNRFDETKPILLYNTYIVRMYYSLSYLIPIGVFALCRPSVKFFCFVFPDLNLIDSLYFYPFSVCTLLFNNAVSTW